MITKDQEKQLGFILLHSRVLKQTTENFLYI